MARKIKNTKSPEERRAQGEALQASITEQVDQLRNSEQWKRFLGFAQTFHSYSFNNILLILEQCPNATHVAGFRKWQALGRVVRRGERGMRVFGFRQKKITADDETEGSLASTDEAGQKMISYHPILSVFGIDQTDLIDPDADNPLSIAHRLTGDDPQGIIAAASDYLNGQGWTVERRRIPGETNGYTILDGTRLVVINADLSPAQAAKTALHEIAYVILHADEDPAECITHRGTKETEAESVAYIVAGILGLDTAARVLRAAHTLVEALTEEPEPAAA